MRKSMTLVESSKRVIGMMSGTSLDGVDLVYCEYKKSQSDNLKWRYRLIACQTYAYPQYILNLIQEMQKPSTTFLQFKNHELSYSKFIVEIIRLFKSHHQIQDKDVDLISLHGHTVFHQPNESLTVQMTNLQYIAAVLGIDVAGNFRELDVFRGCQGAPLAPYGELIFSGEAFINFGGIANISYRMKGYDINFCNLFLNHMSRLIENKGYDKDGSMGREGSPNEQIIKFLHKHNVFKLGQSLARQHFEPYIKQVLEELNSHKRVDILASYYHFLADEICSITDSLIRDQTVTIMCTGGGAKNSYLIELLNQKSKYEFIVPNLETVDFKEAIIFGFLGVKFLEGQQNCEKGIGGCLIKGSHKVSAPSVFSPSKPPRQDSELNKSSIKLLTSTKLQ